MKSWRGSSDPLRLMGKRIVVALLAVAVVIVCGAVWNIYRKNKERERISEKKNKPKISINVA